MNDLKTWSGLLIDYLREFGDQVITFLPSFFGAILILFIGWLFAKLISSGIAKLLKTLNFDVFADRMNATELMSKANISMTPSKFAGKFIYWILLLLVLITASNALGWDMVSQEISKLLNFLPKLFIAIVFFVIGTFIAGFVRDIIRGATGSMGISAGKIISNLVYYLLFIIVTLTALEQAGFPTTIITSNLLMILGTILVAGAISYGFASRDILSNILASFFSRKTFKAGQVIEIDGIQGKIIDASNISVTIQTKENEKVVIPTHELITNKVKIIEDIGKQRERP